MGQDQMCGGLIFFCDFTESFSFSLFYRCFTSQSTIKVWKSKQETPTPPVTLYHPGYQGYMNVFCDLSYLLRRGGTSALSNFTLFSLPWRAAMGLTLGLLCPCPGVLWLWQFSCFHVLSLYIQSAAFYLRYLFAASRAFIMGAPS